MGILILLPFIAIIPASIASGKGHSFAAWWLYGLLLFPIAFFHSLAVEKTAAAKSDPNDLFIELKSPSVKKGDAWSKAAAGLPLKLAISDLPDGRHCCAVESEFGVVASFTDADLIKRLEFRIEAAGKPKARTDSVVIDRAGERTILVRLSF